VLPEFPSLIVDHIGKYYELLRNRSSEFIASSFLADIAPIPGFSPTAWTFDQLIHRIVWNSVLTDVPARRDGRSELLSQENASQH
jgi:hypothetical protein